MRLLHTKELELREFAGEDRPEYAILSHTWGDDEILLGDVQQGRLRPSENDRADGAGLAKVLSAAAVARAQGYEYIWIDTCCIDKSSSAELSEAINSMFAWYRDAAICYAYVSDHDSTSDEPLSRNNRWFTRGWTLQELIAPRIVEFYDRDWNKFGDRDRLHGLVSNITGIDKVALRWHHTFSCPFNRYATAGPECEFCYPNIAVMLNSFSVATRMCWAAGRQTTRREDIAYSLLGMFDVNMPLLYGEGNAAFVRLQLEIVRKSADQTVLAFEPRQDLEWFRANRFPTPLPYPFAESPDCFVTGMGPLTTDPFGPEDPMTLSSTGLEVDLYIAPCMNLDSCWIGVLRCSRVGDAFRSPALVLRETRRSTMQSFCRVPHNLMEVTGGSNIAEYSSEAGRVTFDPAKLRRARILLHKSWGNGKDPFTCPGSRTRSLASAPFNLLIPERYTPRTWATQGLPSGPPDDIGPPVSDRRDPVMRVVSMAWPVVRSSVVCGVEFFKFSRADEGLAIVWGNSRSPFTPSVLRGWRYWWTDSSVQGSWYTQVYPLVSTEDVRPASGNVSEFSFVQTLLDRCRDEAEAATDASELICHRDGSCQRTWMVSGLEPEPTRVLVKVAIEPVMFLDRHVMDIVVTVTRAPLKQAQGGS